MGSSEVTRRIVLRPLARADIVEATEWYRERGYASDFLRAVEIALAEIQQNPFLYRVLARGIRRAPLHRFHYGFMYFAGENELVILTCFHDRRDPRHWRDLAP